ncbi:hypothetical protein [Herbaspirillum sp. SJZ099]|uniref:hypothetical protein n=1 Tax=Herbaspirillum sp. SJZ099 TaxID=2572916 RepID=UPI00119CDA32|nr:hypothetical protein [Herbaspirillum sp. SJZ099]
MNNVELIRRISELEHTVEALQKELNQVSLVFGKNIQELTARSDVFYRTDIALIRRHLDRAEIAKELRSYAHEQSDSDKTHYKTAMLLTVYAMLDASGEPPRL